MNIMCSFPNTNMPPSRFSSCPGLTHDNAAVPLYVLSPNRYLEKSISFGYIYIYFIIFHNYWTAFILINQRLLFFPCKLSFPRIFFCVSQINLYTYTNYFPELDILMFEKEGRDTKKPIIKVWPSQWTMKDTHLYFLSKK